MRRPLVLQRFVCAEFLQAKKDVPFCILVSSKYEYRTPIFFLNAEMPLSKTVSMSLLITFLKFLLFEC